MVNRGIIATHSPLDDLVGREVDSMSWTCNNVQLVAQVSLEFLPSSVCVPAPTITLDMPFQSERAPSNRAIVPKAFEMPVYIALGEGLMTCMRVWGDDISIAFPPKFFLGIMENVYTFSKSTGYITVCSYSPCKLFWSSPRPVPTHSNACERSSKHIVRESRARCERFIAVASY